MKIFLCHSSRDKALVREIRSYLPSYIKSWIDEDDLLVGMDLKVSIKNAIQEETDYVVIFLGREAAISEWIKKELNWAIEREQRIGRVFVLPVLLEDVWDNIEPIEFRDRLYLKCFDQSEAAVKAFAEKLKDQLFAWLCKHLDESRTANLKNQQREETLLNIAKTGKEISEDLAKGLPKNLLEEFANIYDDYKTYKLEIQLERLFSKTKRELSRRREEYKRAKENYEKMFRDNPMGAFSISLTFAAHEKCIEILENLNDEIRMWMDYPEEIDPGEVLGRIKNLLGIN